MIRRSLLALFSFIFFFLVFMPQEVSALTNCYVGGKKVGSLDIFHSELRTNFIAIGEPVSVIFYDNFGVTKSREVSFKLGNSPYQAFTFRDLNSLPWNYGTIFIPGDKTDCGRCFANVVWRSITDGKQHYCTAETVKYKARENLVVKLGSDYRFSYPDTQARQTLFFDSGWNNLEFQVPQDKSCNDYGLYLNGQKVLTFAQAPIDDLNKTCFSHTSRATQSKPVSGGVITVEIKPTLGIVSGSLYQTSSFYGANGLHLLVYDQNSSGTCGGLYNR